jgi:hypothetical protein
VSLIARHSAVAVLTLILMAGLAACGREGPPHPPEGEESNYTFPGFYPNWESTLQPRRSGEQESLTAGEEPEKDPGQPLRPRAGPAFTLEGDGYSRSRSRTY